MWRQEAYLRFDNAAKRDRVVQPAGYLFRIVRNLAIDATRRLALENRHVNGDTAPENLAIETTTPEATVLHRREIQLVKDALAELPERTRVALEMYRFGGSKLKDIAQHLGISVALAHALVHEGIAHCRQRLHARSS